MKKLVFLSLCSLLVSCGTMGIGSNHEVNIHNNSDYTLFATGTSGRVKIEPNSVKELESYEDISLQSSNSDCSELVVSRKVNTAAIILDIIPGIFVGILPPILIDAVSNTLYKMPSDYYYSCN